MKRRLISWLLAIVMLFSLLPAVTVQAEAAQITQVGTIDGNKQHINGLILNAGTVYKVIGNSSNSCSVSNTNTVETGTALEIRGTEASPTVLYIPKGVVLDVKGGPTHPGIQLEEGNMLIVTGGGTLTVTGGDAENGTKGETGEAGKSGHHGYGGKGGTGGRGAGAGIGLRGQAGASGGRRSDAEGGSGETGYPGNSADYTIQTMGKLIVMGDTKVNASSGNPGVGGGKSSGGKGANVKPGTDQSGGGGGGAGGGGSAGYGIGGGGIGGGGGGGGGSGVGGKKSYGADGSDGNTGWSFTLGNDPDAVSDAEGNYYYGRGGNGGGGGGGSGKVDVTGGGNKGGSGGQGLSRAAITSKNNYLAANTQSIQEHGIVEVSTTDDYTQGITTHKVQKLYEGNNRLVTQVANNAISGWVPDSVKYTVTLRSNVNDGSVYNGANRFTSESKTVWLGHTTIPNATNNYDWHLERKGYTLKGYYDSATGGTQYYDANGKALNSTAAWGTDKRYSKAGDLTLYAQWEPVTAKVTFDPNGGVGSSITKTWTYGQTPASLATSELPQNTGYIFSGYFEAKSGGSAIVNAVGAATKASTYTKDTTLYARWTPIKYRVQFYSDDGSKLLGEMKDVAYNSLTLPGANGKSGSTQVFSSISKTDHVFLGWSTVPGLSTAMYEANKHYTVGLADTQNATVRLFPAWRAMENYTITYDANGGTGAPEAETAREDNTGHKLASGVPTRDGYTFLGWATTPVATTAAYQPKESIAKVTADLTLYAVWKQNPSVTYDANGGYFTKSMPIDYPSPKELYEITDVKPVREGYTFVGWECNGVVYNPRDHYILNGSYAAITFTAKWAKAQYTLTLEEDANVKLTFDEPTGVKTGNKYAYETEFVFSAEGDGTVRVYVNGVLISPQDDGKYHFTMTDDTTVKTTLTAKVPEYIVSYDPNGGHDAPNDNRSYPQGATVTVKDQGSMFRTGYTFNGWKDDDGNDVGSSFTITKDTTLHAQWTANKYSITYDANGVTDDMTATELTYDVDGKISENEFTRTGYDFAGWSWTQDGLVAYLGGETVKNLTDKAETLKLYAIWTPKQTTVTLDAMGGDPDKSYVRATYGEEMPSITTPTRTGYTFAGFYDLNRTRYYDENGKSTFAWDKTDADVTLYASWTANTYKVEYNATTGSGDMAETPMTYDASQRLAANAFTAPTAGYTFAGWSLRPDGATVDFIDQAEVKNLTAEKDGIVTLYAVWQPIPTYTVTYNANGGTGGPENSAPVTEGKDYTIPNTEPTREGYKFLGWSENPAAAEADSQYAPGKSVEVRKNITLYAVWQKIATYTITYESGVSDDSVSNLPPAGEKTEGVPYSLSRITPVREGYDFKGWSKYNGGEKDFSAGATYEDDKDLTLYAVWEAKSYKLTIRDNGLGTVEVMNSVNPPVELHDGDTIHYDDVLVIKAHPQVGYSTASFWCTVNDLLIANDSADVIYKQWPVTGNVVIRLLDRRATSYTVQYDANGGKGTIDDLKVTSTVSATLSDGAGFTKDHCTLIGWNTAADGTGTPYALGATLAAPIATDGGTVKLYAVWKTDETFAVVYDANGGTGVPTDENDYFTGDEVTVKFTDVPTRAGYDFLGWSTDRRATTAEYTENGNTTFTMAADNVTLYAVWQRERYSVDIDDGGVADVTLDPQPDANGKYEGDTPVTFTVKATGSNVLNKLTVTVNGSVVRMTEQNGVLTGSFTITQDSTITVRSGAQTYTVTYDKNGGDTPAQDETATGITGEPLTLNSGKNYTKDGYHLTGWNTERDGSGVTYDLGVLAAGFSGNTTLYAVWEENADPKGYSYTVHYDANGGTGTVADQTQYQYDFSTALYDLADVSFTKEHATLVGWSTAPNGSVDYALGAQLVMPLAVEGKTITLYAVWQAEGTYTVTYDANGGTGTLPSDRNFYHQNDKVTVEFRPAPTREGYIFLGWAETANAQTPKYDSTVSQFTMGTANVTLYAVWQQAEGTYTVTYDANGGTGDVPADPSAYAQGAKVNVRFTPEPRKDGCSFLGWATSAAATAPSYTASRSSFSMPRGNVTLYAVWHRIEQYTITYHANAGSDAVIGMPGEGEKTEDVPYTISAATPTRAGYSFLGWSSTANGAVELHGGDSYTANANLELYAVWQRRSYTLTVANGGVSTVTITPQADASGKYVGDTTITVTVTPTGTYTAADLTVTLNGTVLPMTQSGNQLRGSFQITRDSTLTVGANTQTYTVTYDPNGGDAPASPVTMTYVTYASMTLHGGAGFTKSGYHITGWNEQRDGSGMNYGLAGQIPGGFTANTTLYAVWEDDSTLDPNGYPYTICYVNDEDGRSATQTMYQNVSDRLYTADQVSFERDGYELVGWSLTAGGDTDYSLGARIHSPLGRENETVTLYAVWEKEETDVIVDLEDPLGVNTRDFITVPYRGRYGRLPKLSKDGYIFEGWFDRNDKKIESTTRVTNSRRHTLYAEWTKIGDDGGNGGNGGGGSGSDRVIGGGYSGGYEDCPRDRTCPAYPFKDLDLKLWYHDGIHFCVENDLMQGVSGGRFAPNGLTTRAQIVTILWRIEGTPYVDYAAFTDVHDGDWFAPAVQWAAANGIVVGYSSGRFGPNDSVTREQLAAILYRYAQYLESDVSAGEDTNILSYDDADRIGSWAFDAIQWACGSGIIGGTSARTLAPKATATRAQVAAMILRFLALV